VNAQGKLTVKIATLGAVAVTIIQVVFAYPNVMEPKVLVVCGLTWVAVGLIALKEGAD
jgi:hypothetical protein